MNIRGCARYAVFSLFCLCILCQKVSSQEDPLDKLMTVKVIRCPDVMLNAVKLIPRFYYDEKIDSMRIVLNYWEKKCNRIEPIFRVTALLDIQQELLRETLFDEYTIFHLINYKRRVQRHEKDGSFNPWSHDMLDDGFDYFTWDFANKLLPKTRLGSIEHLLCEFYTNKTDSFFLKLSTLEYSNTHLHQLFKDELQKILEYSETYYGITTGLWIPRGNNKLLGNHPELALWYGMKKDSYYGDLIFGFRFLESKEQYQVEYEGSIVDTKTFQSYWIGFEAGYQFYRSGASAVGGLLCLSYDDLTSIYREGEKKPKSTGTASLSIGGEYRYYFGEYGPSYLATQLFFHVMSYNNVGGTNISGSSLSFRLTYGIGSDNGKGEILKELGYKY